MTTRQNNPLTRAAPTAPATFNREARSVEATIATNAPVEQRDSRGPYLEILDPAGLDLSAAQGVRLLDSHRKGSARDVIGTVGNVRRMAGEIVATLQFSKADDVSPIVERIADGTLQGVSIGYRILESRVSQSGGRRIVTATRWRLVEASIVADPADIKAAFRSQKGQIMSNLNDGTPADTGGNPDDGDKSILTRSADTETRKEIRALVKAADLGPDIADQLIDSGCDLTRAKAEILDHLTRENKDKPLIRSVSQTDSNDDPVNYRRRAGKALRVRMGVALDEKDGDAEAVRGFMGLSLRDMAGDCLTRAGVSTRGLPVLDVFERAAQHSTSDFPLIVADSMTSVALASYRAAESALKQLCRRRSLVNFKDSQSIRLGEMGQLEKLDEGGEIRHTSRGEAGEKMALETYARAITLSRTLLLNDDLGMLADTVSALGSAAAQTEASILAGLLNDNPNLSDGTAVFHADRGNISDGQTAEPAVAALTEARKAMRTRKGLDGETIIDIAPRFIVTGANGETSGEQVLADLYPNSVGNVNPFAAKLGLVVEPRLDNTAWYVFADPARTAALQYGYLASAEGVQIARQEHFWTLGMNYRGVLDFGAGWLDWRPAHKITA